MSALLPLQDFVPALTPRFSAPRHLAPLLGLFERVARGERVRAVVSVPPRHSKTETCLHGIAWLLLQDPSLQVAYASYAARIAEKKSRRARGLAELAGVPLAADSKSRRDWRTDVDDGGVWATSVDGAITGEGFHLVVLDDLVKGRAQAESATIRDRAHSWLMADVLTRCEPGASIIASGTRWHPDDPLGRLVNDGWEYVCLPALDPSGAALWPQRWPASELERIREQLGGPDGYEWQSLYQGNPRGRGARVFNDVHTYDSKPAAFEQICIGIDYAYSARTSADFSVAVVLGLAGGVFYVLDVVRVQVEPRMFRDRVALLVQTYPGATCSAWVAATERGGIEFFRESGIPITERTAVLDKFSRAIGVTAAWNTGKVLVPASATWLDKFVSELAGFTGVKDRHDDQVDALAAAFDGLNGAAWQPVDWNYMDQIGTAALGSWGAGSYGGWSTG
jgi:predicted phage terminase large subunit-like protein